MDGYRVGWDEFQRRKFGHPFSKERRKEE